MTTWPSMVPSLGQSQRTMFPSSRNQIKEDSELCYYVFQVLRVIHRFIPQVPEWLPWVSHYAWHFVLMKLPFGWRKWPSISRKIKIIEYNKCQGNRLTHWKVSGADWRGLEEKVLFQQGRKAFKGQMWHSQGPEGRPQRRMWGWGVSERAMKWKSDSARIQKLQEGACILKHWVTVSWVWVGERHDLIYILKALKNNLKWWTLC